MIDGTSSFAEEYNLQTLIEKYNKRNGQYVLNECVWLFCVFFVLRNGEYVLNECVFVLCVVVFFWGWGGEPC